MKKSRAAVKLVAVGSIGLDTIETPSERRVDILGGSLSYACVAAACFARVGMVGVVGQDFPRRYLSLYRRSGIDLAGLRQEPGQTFRWSGVYEADMINRRTLSTELNVFARFTPELPPAYRRVPHVLLGNISPGLQLHVLKQVERPRFILADTMDLWIRTDRKTLLKVIRRATMLTLNDSEARQLTGEHNLRQAARHILKWGPTYVVIKKGEHGAMLFSRNGIFLVPAYPVEDVRDPTGAGDSFAGGFMGLLAARGRLDESSVRAALVAGSVVASFGVEAFSLDRLHRLSGARIRARMQELERMVRIRP